MSQGPTLASRANPFCLTHMQVEVLRRVVEGQTYDQIAAALTMSKKTVETHLARARKRIGKRNTLSAAIAFDRAWRPTA